jgi:hypothetical protein
MSTRNNLFVLVALSLFVCVGPTHAASIAVANFSFEQPSVGESPTSTGTVSQAADTAIPGWGADMPAGTTAGVQIGLDATDGVQIAYVNGKGDAIYQDVGGMSRRSPASP